MDFQYGKCFYVGLVPYFWAIRVSPKGESISDPTLVGDVIPYFNQVEDLSVTLLPNKGPSFLSPRMGILILSEIIFIIDGLGDLS